MSNLILNFPENFTPNNSQVTVLKKADKALADGKKYIIINAPTGSGKSFIPKTLANSVNGPSEAFVNAVKNYSIFTEEGANVALEEEPFGCYALTITKTLQDQYKDTFSDTGILKGQSNYQCQIDDSLTVDVAPCIYVKGLKNECWKANKCPYYNSRNEMLVSPFSSLNYSMFFSLPESLRKRKIIVCDEASELEEQLVNQFTCEINIPFLVKTEVDIKPFPTSETPTKVLEWLSHLIGNVSSTIEEYMSFFKRADSKKDAIAYNKKKVEYTKLTNLHGSLALLIETYYDSQYIIEHVEKNIKFTPLKVDKLSNHLFKHAEHVILLSATIIDHKNYAKNLGITDYEYIEVDSQFDPKKAPIYVMVKQKINYANLLNMLPKLCGQIEGILEQHDGEKGIIHSHTQYITDYVRDNVNSRRLLCRELGVKNEDILEEHCSNTSDTVLVSPSMTYGVDLKGDLAKFQIIVKTPWLPTKDKRVEKMMKMDKDWYVNKMLQTIVQASGRGIRSESDECVTYILDGSSFDAIDRNKHKLPKFWLDRFE